MCRFIEGSVGCNKVVSIEIERKIRMENNQDVIQLVDERGSIYRVDLSPDTAEKLKGENADLFRECGKRKPYSDAVRLSQRIEKLIPGVRFTVNSQRKRE